MGKGLELMSSFILKSGQTLNRREKCVSFVQLGCIKWFHSTEKQIKIYNVTINCNAHIRLLFICTKFTIHTLRNLWVYSAMKFCKALPAQCHCHCQNLLQTVHPVGRCWQPLVPNTLLSWSSVWRRMESSLPHSLFCYPVKCKLHVIIVPLSKQQPAASCSSSTKTTHRSVLQNKHHLVTVWDNCYLWLR